jgi:hypothetical protein
MERKIDCVDKSPIKIQPPNGWGIGASTPQSRRRKIAMRSLRACTAAAEYCGEPQQKLLKALLLIALNFLFFFNGFD